MKLVWKKLMVSCSGSSWSKSAWQCCRHMRCRSRTRKHRPFRSCTKTCVSRMCPCSAYCRSSKFGWAECQRCMMRKKSGHPSFLQISRSQTGKQDRHQTSTWCRFRSSKTTLWSAPSKVHLRLSLCRAFQCQWLRARSLRAHRWSGLKSLLQWIGTYFG